MCRESSGVVGSEREDLPDGSCDELEEDRAAG